jgi:hypothetical protein
MVLNSIECKEDVMRISIVESNLEEKKATFIEVKPFLKKMNRFHQVS